VVAALKFGHSFDDVIAQLMGAEPKPPKRRKSGRTVPEEVRAIRSSIRKGCYFVRGEFEEKKSEVEQMKMPLKDTFIADSWAAAVFRIERYILGKMRSAERSSRAATL